MTATGELVVVDKPWVGGGGGGTPPPDRHIHKHTHTHTHTHTYTYTYTHTHTHTHHPNTMHMPYVLRSARSRAHAVETWISSTRAIRARV